MKKTTTIAIASIFAVTALFAVNQTMNPESFGYNVDVNHASLEKNDEFGYNVDVNHASLEKNDDFGYNVDVEHASLEKNDDFGYSVDEEIHS